MHCEVFELLRQRNFELHGTACKLLELLRTFNNHG